MLEPCNCMCHTTGYATYLTSNPPQPCCKCIFGMENIMNNYNHTDINPLCPAHTNQPWSSVIPPKCICGQPQTFSPPDAMPDIKINPLSPLVLELKQQISEIQHEISKLKVENGEICKGQRNLVTMTADMVKDMRDQLHRLEQSREAHSKSNKQLFERIEHLENDTRGELPTQFEHTLIERVEILETKTINSIHERIEKLGSVLSDMNVRIETSIAPRLHNLEAVTAQQFNESSQQCNPEKDEKVGAIEPCVHDFDYTRVLTSIPPCYQCKKCGIYSNQVGKQDMSEIVEMPPPQKVFLVINLESRYPEAHKLFRYFKDAEAYVRQTYSALSVKEMEIVE